MVGLEISDQDSEWIPTVRLVSDGLQGIVFTVNDWEAFKKTFEDISRYYSGESKVLSEATIFGGSWTLRFTTSHNQRAIEILENIQYRTGDPIKRFRRSIVLHEVTFKWLKTDVAKCVDCWLQKLTTMTAAVNTIIEELTDFIKTEAGLHYDGQIQEYEPEYVRELTKSVPSEVFEKIKSKCSSGCIDIVDTQIITYELLTYHVLRIVSSLNMNIKSSEIM